MTASTFIHFVSVAGCIVASALATVWGIEGLASRSASRERRRDQVADEDAESVHNAGAGAA